MFLSQMEEKIAMYTLKIYVSESVMYWLLIPSIPDDFPSSFDIYLPSSETERYGITNGSSPPVFCLPKSCRRFEYSYTVVCGSVNDSDIGRKCIIIENICTIFRDVD